MTTDPRLCSCGHALFCGCCLLSASLIGGVLLLLGFVMFKAGVL